MCISTQDKGSQGNNTSLRRLSPISDRCFETWLTSNNILRPKCYCIPTTLVSRLCESSMLYSFIIIGKPWEVWGGGRTVQDMIIVLTTKIKILHWWSLVWHYYATCTVLHTSKNICAACSLDLFPLCTSFLILRGWGPSCTLVLRILSVSEVPTTSSSSFHRLYVIWQQSQRLGP